MLGLCFFQVADAEKIEISDFMNTVIPIVMSLAIMSVYHLVQLYCIRIQELHEEAILHQIEVSPQSGG